MVTGFSHYNLVADRQLLDDIRRFYIDIVGLQQGSRPPFKRFGYWLYAGQQAVLHLTEALPSEERQKITGSTFDHVAFTCNDIASATARLRTRGIPYHIDVVPQTGEQQVFFSDPAGNGVELNGPQGTVASC